MKYNKKEIIGEIYSNELTSINGINFTPREVDVISCLLSARGTNKIAYFLSIYPKTVRNHIHNIMTKLDCNSRDAIIDFVEKSGKLSSFKKHCVNLQISTVFKKTLKDIAKLTRETSPCAVVHWRNPEPQNLFIDSLEAHLEYIGFNVSTEVKQEPFSLIEFIKETSPEENVVYVLPRVWLEKIDKDDIPAEKIIQTKKRILFLISETEAHTEISKEFATNFVTIDLAQYQNYYFAFLEILKKLLSSCNLEKPIAEFKDHFENIQDTSIPNLLKAPLEKTENNFKNQTIHSLQNKNLSFISVSLFIAVVSLIFLLTPDHRKKETNQNKIQFPSPSFSHENHNELPIRSDLIIPTESVLLNRPELMAQIDSKLKKQNAIQTVAFIGIGGTGKTTLARQYAYSQKLPLIWEINAESDENLKGSFENLSHALVKTEEDQKKLKGLLAIKNPLEKEEAIIKFVRERLKLHKNWLLIYDNVETFNDLQKYFPHDPILWGEGKIILTTRDANIENNTHVNGVLIIGELTPDQKLNLFKKIMTNGNITSFTVKQSEEAKKFLEKIPPFPLDISIAAYYIKTTNIPFEKYLERLLKNNSEFDNLQKTILSQSVYYNKTRYNIVSVSVEHLINTYKSFQDLLLFIALVDSQNIPRDLLDGYNSSSATDNFIYNLKKYSLIINEFSPKDSIKPTFSLHRSTQTLILAHLRKILNLDKNNNLLQKISNYLEAYTTDIIDNEDYSKMRLLVSHYEKLLSHNKLLSNTMRYSMEGALGCIYYYLGYYLKAKEHIEASLKSQDIDYVKRARLIMHLGDVYRNLGDYEKAKKLLEHSYKIYKEHISKYHNDFPRILAHLGNVYRILGNYEKAKDLLEQSLLIYKDYFPENHNDIAKTLTHLGSLYRILGDYEKATRLLEQSLRVYRQHISENHAGVPRALMQLASVHRILGNYEKSKDLLSLGLQIYTKHFPENYNHNARNFIHLGNIYRKLGDHKKAEDFLEQSLQIFKENFPEDHIENSWALAHLGIVNRELGNYEKAKNLIEQSLVIFRKHFPEDHIEISWALAHLGIVNRELGNYEEAKNLIEQSLSIYEKCSFDSSLYVAWRTTQLGNVYKELGDYEQARKLLEKSVGIYQNKLGNKNIRLSHTSAHLGNIYRLLGNHEKAKELLEQSLEIHKSYFQKDHLKIAWICLYLGIVYKELGDLKKAKNMFQESLRTYQKTCGNNCLEVARILKNMAEVYILENHLESAENHLNKALSILQDLNHPEAYLTLESLGELYLKKANQQMNKENLEQAQNLKKKSSTYLNAALKIVITHFPKNSPHLKRIQAKLKGFK